jgi:hypothetical protein
MPSLLGGRINHNQDVVVWNFNEYYLDVKVLFCDLDEVFAAKGRAA